MWIEWDSLNEISDGHIHYFNGSEIGALMIKYLVDRTTLPKYPVMIQSIVSGELGKRFAKQHGVTVKEVLMVLNLLPRPFAN